MRSKWNSLFLPASYSMTASLLPYVAPLIIWSAQGSFLGLTSSLLPGMEPQKVKKIINHILNQKINEKSQGKGFSIMRRKQNIIQHKFTIPISLNVSIQTRKHLENKLFSKSYSVLILDMEISRFWYRKLRTIKNHQHLLMNQILNENIKNIWELKAWKLMM